MRDYLPPGSTGRTASLELPAGATVADVIGLLGAAEHLVFAVLVDDETAGMTDTLTEGATVTLMPPFTGGACLHSIR
jgi:molybdopterin converting factor small subunit